ncbi:MAG: hypothetical protein JW994_05620 [Candidatus Omnitrophica bacterium]|nr:hypothetical protein [Candidatus Omnitrophota bacterium]
MSKIFYCIVILTAVVIIAHINTLKNDFVFLDDYKFIIDNPEIKPLNISQVAHIFIPPKELIKNRYLFYAPLRTLAITISYNLYGKNPRPYHILNISFHLLASIAAFCFVLSITKKIYPAFWASVFFALHPVHVEAVTWISAGHYPLTVFFIFLSLILYTKKYRWRAAYFVSVISYICALLFHASSVNLPFLIFIYDLNFAPKEKTGWLKRVKGYLPYIVIGLLACAVFHYYNGLLYPSLDWKVIPVMVITRIAIPLGMLTFPFFLYYIGYNFHTIWTPFLIEILKLCVLLILFTAVLAVKNFNKMDRVKSFSIMWIFVYLLFFVQMSIFTRYLYPPSFGFCLLLASYLHDLAKRPSLLKSRVSGKTLSLTLCFLVAFSYLAITVKENISWQDSFALETRLLRYPEFDARLGAGDFYAQHGEWKKAEYEYREAENIVKRKCGGALPHYDTRLVPIYERMYDLYKKSGDALKAEEYLRKLDKLKSGG